jgi:hypothetical protein
MTKLNWQTMANKRLLGLLAVAAVLVVVAVLAFHPAPSKKATPPTPQQAAQIDCATKAHQDYAREQAAELLAATADVTKLLSIERTLMQRRRQELFCLRFAQCLTDPNNQAAAMIAASYFSSCLRDEALEGYDAVPREDTGN